MMNEDKVSSDHAHDFHLDPQQRGGLREVAAKLELDVNILADGDLIQEVLNAPGGEKHFVGSDPTIHSAVRTLCRTLAREDGYVDNGQNCSRSTLTAAYIEAAAKPGTEPWSMLSIDAHLLSTDDTRPTADDVHDWIERQPTAILGLLTVVAGSGRTARPSICLSSLSTWWSTPFSGTSSASSASRLPKHGTTARSRRAQDLELGPGGPPTGCWTPSRSIEERLAAHRQRGKLPRHRGPRWIVGDGPSRHLRRRADRLEERRTWGPRPDLLRDPEKAAHFVARLASQPYWQNDGDVAYGRTVNPNQWWDSLTPANNPDGSPDGIEYSRAPAAPRASPASRSPNALSPTPAPGSRKGGNGMASTTTAGPL